jgi:hypothetical protein
MGVVTQLVAEALAPPGHARFARLRPGGARASAVGRELWRAETWGIRGERDLLEVSGGMGPRGFLPARQGLQ